MLALSWNRATIIFASANAWKMVDTAINPASRTEKKSNPRLFREYRNSRESITFT